jgi:serine/threonine protein kinase
LALTPGSRIGVYDITTQIGEGCVGQVYRATETKLKRHVAIRILAPSVAADADRSRASSPRQKSWLTRRRRHPK